MRGLREQTRQRMLDVFRSLQIGEPGAVLLCDKLALRAISCVCRVSEILEEGITLVESLAIVRQPIPNFAAVYLITPSVESINMMLDDFKDPRKPMYGDVHILFTSSLPDSLLNKIKLSGLVSRVKTFRELNFEYLAIESGAFILDAPDAMPAIYAPNSASAVPEQHRMATQLCTLFAMYGEMPYIRFAAKGHPSASSFAYIVQEKLERLGKASGCFNPQPGRPRAERPTLLIVDRSIDPLAPLLHEYSYQAMIQDLLPIADGERYTQRKTLQSGEESKKEVLLNETDPLWPKLRHMHIAEAIEYLTTNMKQLKAANQATAKLRGNMDMSGRDLSEALRGMPKYLEEEARFALHLGLTGELMRRFKQNHLEVISTLEQNMALGEDEEGREVKGSKLVEALLDMVRRDISPQDKMRLLMAFIISQEGIRDEDRRKLMDAAGLLPEDQAAIVNLFYLGVNLTRGTSKGAPRRKPAAKSQGPDAYTLTRYTPVLKLVAEDVLTQAPAAAGFPYVKDKPAGVSPADVSLVPTARAGDHPAPSWASRGRSTKKEEAQAAGPRLVIFVIGGATYSELKCGYELSKAHQREVLIGSSSMLTPYQYIAQLKRIKKSDVFGE